MRYHRHHTGFTQHHFFSDGKKSGAGFTLIELLIVAAVFAVAFLLATTVFVNIQSHQRGIAGRQRVVADGRYVLEAMARTVRLGTVDYRYYRDPENDGLADDELFLSEPQTILATRDQQGNQICYRLQNNKLQTISNTPNCSGTWNDITPSDISVTTFQVLITPWSDPYLGPRTSTLECNAGANLTSDGACTCDDSADGLDNDIDENSCLLDQRCAAAGTGPEICLNPNRQPTVTIVLETQNVNQTSGEQSSAALQTTVVSRMIRR